MADVLINKNNHRIDDEDMDALIAALDGLGYSAGVDPSQRVHAGQASDWWTLVLRWVGDEAGRVAFDGALVYFFTKAKKHFVDRGKVQPARAEVYDQFDLGADCGRGDASSGVCGVHGQPAIPSQALRAAASLPRHRGVRCRRVRPSSQRRRRT